MNLSILYRGPLSGCNYSCQYCPFAKTKNSREELLDDTRKLNRFVDWIESHSNMTFSILFTPWGEALIRSSYQKAIVRLSQMPQVSKVAIQTNLSCRLSWLNQAEKNSVALWATYHPGETSRERFLAQCAQLDAMQVRYSVGVVGFKEALPEIEALRALLPSHIYLWVNALKKQEDYYSEEDKARLIELDPLVLQNMTHHPSFGKACKTGQSVISVDGEGTIKRCHFIDERLGNIYDPNFHSVLKPRACTNQTCGCHIGYVHLDHLNLYDVYGDGVLERITQTSVR